MAVVCHQCNNNNVGGICFNVAENVAAGKPCNMSTELNSYSPNNAANDDTGQDYSTSNCIQTNVTAPYWTVDLGKYYDINLITIFGISTGADGRYFLAFVFFLFFLVKSTGINKLIKLFFLIHVIVPFGGKSGGLT